MRRFLIAFWVCALVVLNLVVADVAQAQTIAAFSLPTVSLADTAVETQKDLIQIFEDDVLPQIESVLSPEQRDRFKGVVSNGFSFRKAFKVITLSPDQKEKLGSIIRSLPKRDLLASLTPEQKKQLFLKKKEAFIPTPEEITEKISAGMTAKGKSMPERVSQKVSEKLKSKEAFIPTPEAIGAKISAGMEALKDKLEGE